MTALKGGRFKAAKRTAEIEYAIRDVIIPAERLEAGGVRLIKLNIGDPNEFDFDVPPSIKEALKMAVDEGYNNYAPSEGDEELRQATAEREKRRGINVEASDIIVTHGVSEAIQMLFGAILDSGDEVLIPGPSYPPYVALAKFFDAKPVPYRMIEEDGWKPDIEDLKSKITEKTKLLIVNSPNNPTGTVYPKKTLMEIVNLAGEKGILIASNEIYAGIVYEEEFYSPAHLAKDLPMIVLNGFSKYYLMTGWRLGYAAFINPNGELDEVKEAFLKQARIRVSANTPCQRAAIAAIRGSQEHADEIRRKLKERRDYFYKRINEIKGLSAQKPQGAFYIFPKIEDERWRDDKRFVIEVLNKAHVLLVHGSGFCPIYGKGHFRSVFLPPIKILEEALDALEAFMEGKLG